MTRKLQPKDNRRRATLNEAKAFRPEQTVVMPDGSAGMFLALENRPTGRNARKVAAAMVRQAAEAGFELEVLAVTPGFNPGTFSIQFLLVETKKSKMQAAEAGVFNTERVWSGSMILRNAANLDLARKPERVWHMQQFAEAGEFVNGTQKHLKWAFVKRLFDEGLLERHPQNADWFRPSPAGLVWLKAAR